MTQYTSIQSGRLVLASDVLIIDGLMSGGVALMVLDAGDSTTVSLPAYDGGSSILPPLASGAFTKLTVRTIFGSLVTFGGIIGRTSIRQLQGSLVFTEAIAKRTAKRTVAGLAPTVVFIPARVFRLAASLNFSGSMRRLPHKMLRADIFLTGLLPAAYTRFVNIFLFVRTSVTNLVLRDRSVIVDPAWGGNETSVLSVVQIQEQEQHAFDRGDQL